MAQAESLRHRLDRGLALLRAHPRQSFLDVVRGHPQPELAASMFRQTLESLLVLDVIRDVPTDAELPGPLAARLAEEQHVVLRSTLAHHVLLSGLSDGEKRAISHRVRREGDPTMHVAEWIDAQGRSVGVTGDSRLKLRRAAVDVTARIRRQSAAAVIDDAVQKVDRVIELGGPAMVTVRATVSRALSAGLWPQLDATPTAAGTTGHPAGAQTQEDAEWAQAMTPQGQRLWSSAWGRPGDSEIETAAVLMPLGLATCGVTLIIGLVTLFVGIAQNEDWDGRRRTDP